MRNIECEIRAEIKVKDFPALLRKLKRQGKFLSKTKRLSVMFFRCDGKADLDLRVRTTDGNCEIVMKRGDHHGHDRVETSQEIEPKQFVGTARVFRQFDWDSVKIGERVTQNFDFKSGVVISLVRGGNIGYLEIEKMATQKSLAKVQVELEAIADDLGVKLIRTRKEYYALCQRFTDTTDWQLKDKPAHYKKLAGQLKKYF